MPTTRHILRGLRAAAALLLGIAVLIGPAGLGGSPAFATPSACGVFCPCDSATANFAEQHERAARCDTAERSSADSQSRASTDDECGRTDAEQDDREPCRDECPDDCPNCGCHLSAVMGVLPSSPTTGAASYTSARSVPLQDAPPGGEHSAVFRPPRAH